ncbi:MAG: ribosome silencing factor [Prevotellaceae bacterium]|jgi:ribosome-associated protein|nr:ribosome silencing factor [Prevotellaceae bacterium]
MTKEDKNLIDNIVAGMQEQKAKKIAVIDMTALEAPCRFFVVCEGTSSTQVDAIAETMKDFVRKNAKIKPFAIDGTDNAQWIAMDYGDAIVHIFQRETREFYDIEHLWNDAKIEYVKDLD